MFKHVCVAAVCVTLPIGLLSNTDVLLRNTGFDYEFSDQDLSSDAYASRITYGDNQHIYFEKDITEHRDLGFILFHDDDLYVRVLDGDLKIQHGDHTIVVSDYTVENNW